MRTISTRSLPARVRHLARRAVEYFQRRPPQDHELMARLKQLTEHQEYDRAIPLAEHLICPDNIPPSEGLTALNSLLEARMGHRVARFLDTLFDMFVN